MKTEIVSTLNNASCVPDFTVAGAINWKIRQLLIYLGFVCDGGFWSVATSFAKSRSERRIFGGLFKNLQGGLYFRKG